MYEVGTYLTDYGSVIEHEGLADELGHHVPHPLNEAHPVTHGGHHGGHEGGKILLNGELLNTGGKGEGPVT